MNRRKLHISQWCLLGLAAILVVLCLVAGTGSALARYRAETQAHIWFAAQTPPKIYLGQMRLADDGTTHVFDDKLLGTWERTDGTSQLDFAVANSTPTTDAPADDQQVRILLVGSPGVWDGAETANISLLVPQKNDASKYDTYEATAVKIQPKSALYEQFGDGWVYTFRNKMGEELTWNLTGGRFSCYEMRLVLDGTLTDTTLLQLQVIG